MPRTSRIFCPKIAILSQFQVYLSKANNKFITCQQFLSSDIVPTSSKRKRRIIVHGFGHSLRSAISCQRKQKDSTCYIIKTRLINRSNN